MDFKVLPFQRLPPTQALSSKTFKAPPLDGSLTVPEIYDWHLLNTPNHPLFVYCDDLGQNHALLWPEVVRAVHRAGRCVRTMVCPGSDTSVPPDSPAIIAILSAADTITYYTMVVSILRAGHIAFPISPRNSPAAIAHLLGNANVKHMIIGQERTFRILAEAAIALLEGSEPPFIHRMPKFEDVYVSDSEKDFMPLTFKKPDLEQTAVILHSSGSTAFPKAIRWSHYHILHVAVFPWFSGRDLTGYRISCHAIPMFHGMGINLTNWTCTSGLVLACFAPHTPAIVPTPTNVLKAIVDSDSSVAFSTPLFVEVWSRDVKSVKTLQGLDGVMFGGGPLDRGVGDRLTAKGVKLSTTYGASECGCFSKLFSDLEGNWEYYEMAGSVDADYLPDGNGNFEFIVKPGPWMLPSVFNTSVNGIPAYATGDLVTPHPSKPNFWKIYGRTDDQIIHSTGEKTNPVPLENILNQDPHIRSAVMFGRGKFNAGVIVDPASFFKVDPTDVEALAEFRQKIWPSVEKMNEHAPQHSRLFKEMILVSDPSKPFTYTAKLTARRQTIIKDYADEIKQLYESVDASTQPDLLPPLKWDLPDALQFIRTVVGSVLNESLDDEDDMFQCGCDSLQATWIRNTLLNALRRSSNLDVRSIPINFLYENPTISMLAKFMSQLSPSYLSMLDRQATGRKVREMEELARRYSAEFKFPVHVPASSSSLAGKEGIVILLTGTTGGLGSTLLAKLIASPEVTRIYALNRRVTGEILRRQKEAFALRALDARLFTSSKLVLLEGNLADDILGLDKDCYEEIKTSVTHIIHTAYTVNFNLALSTFESNIRGLRCLVDLALASPHVIPPRLLFTSSIGVVRNCVTDGPVKEDDVDATAAVGTGYSESKWVCERILAVASERTSLKPIILRIGQMTGASMNGYWNPKEWVPTLFRSSVSIGCLPSVSGTISWLPVDVAAAALIEMRDAPNGVLHIAHPKPIPWMKFVKPISEKLHLPLLPYPQWFKRLESLEKADRDRGSEKADDSSALYLQEFFRSFSSSTVDGSTEGGEAGEKGEAMGLKQLDLACAVGLSSSLRGCKPLDVEEATKWLTSWGLIGREMKDEQD